MMASSAVIRVVVKLLVCCFSSRNGIFDVFKSTKMDAFAIAPYCCCPPIARLIPTNAHKPAAICIPKLLVSTVSAVRHRAKIGKSIIAGVVIDVVYLKGHAACHEYECQSVR